MNFTYFPMQRPMAIIKRPKLTGIGAHVGVLCPNGYVFHSTDDKGVHLTTLDGFAKGRRVEVVEEVPFEKHGETQARIQQELILRQAYNVFTNNCEIVANRVVGNPAKSKQVAFWLTLTTLAGVAAIATAN